MLKTVAGLFRKGQIELVERPGDIPNDTRVLVTFIEAPGIDLAERGLDTEQAAALRARLSSFVEEWDSEEMDIYDHYDEAPK
ncbi:MAG: hypothetical protein GKR89_35645 [Candidatus Latescibacteria bacterium]|nr:hypothetical protein [Candidatus Latescibacterota bacterium]